DTGRGERGHNENLRFHIWERVEQFIGFQVHTPKFGETQVSWFCNFGLTFCPPNTRNDAKTKRTKNAFVRN
ncbi:MAG TPA: hypothetical protein VJW76_14970, partial [Verrucomicrobiae bacterium]|nr:hypothetical protein [Verrucomicrobiae bacterium]